MDGQTAKVYCRDCDRWLTVDPETERVACECGRRYVVTVTPIPERPA